VIRTLHATGSREEFRGPFTGIVHLTGIQLRLWPGSQTAQAGCDDTYSAVRRGC